MLSRLSWLIPKSSEQQKLDLVSIEEQLEEFCNRVKQNLDGCGYVNKKLALEIFNTQIIAIPEHLDIKITVPLEFITTGRTWRCSSRFADSYDFGVTGLQVDGKAQSYRLSGQGRNPSHCLGIELSKEQEALVILVSSLMELSIAFTEFGVMQI